MNIWHIYSSILSDSLSVAEVRQSPGISGAVGEEKRRKRGRKVFDKVIWSGIGNFKCCDL